MTNSIKNFGARCAAYVKWHYSDVTLRRTDKQIEREQKLLGLVPFNRWFLVCYGMLNFTLVLQCAAADACFL